MKNIILSILIILIFTCGCSRQNLNSKKQDIAANAQEEVTITANEKDAATQSVVKENINNIEQQENRNTVNKENIHPFEIATQECMKQKNYTTAGMNECVYEEMDKWFAEIDKYMGLLKSAMSEESYKDLQEVQAKWKEYQKAEFNTINIIHKEKQGTIFQNIEAANRNKVIKERAQSLKEFYEILTLE